MKIPGQTGIRYVCCGSDNKMLSPFPVDPWELTKYTRTIVCKTENNIPLRKYTDFYAVGVYGGIATAYSVGCNFRCIFCWVDWSRDWPELYGKFYSPDHVFSRLSSIMKTKGLRRARISGAEPTLCPDHLFNVLELVHKERDAFDLFVIETNGIVISQDDTFCRKLIAYARANSKQSVGHVRLSIRGGLPSAFTAKTGCAKEFFDLPFIAAQRLHDASISFHVAVVVDPRFTSAEEKKAVYERLSRIDRSIAMNVEEEFLDPYPHALVRLRAAGRADVAGKTISGKEQFALSKKPSI